MESEESIREFLKQKNVALVGFTSADKFEDWARVSTRRLQDGTLPVSEAGMLVSDPCRILPKARTVIVFVIKYDGFIEETEPNRASISGNSWGRAAQLELSELLSDRLNESGYMAVPNPDIPLKAAAVRAGLGLQRKNTVTYYPEIGSAARIGGVLTDLELTPGRKIDQEPCGKCTLCIDACPTGALVDDYTLDASRCFCYLLEQDGTMPPELRPMLGNRLLGCEVCETACPHNSDVPRLSMGDKPWLDLESLAEAAVDDFGALKSRFRDDYGFFLEGEYCLARTIAINLGNWGDLKALPFLERLKESPWPEVVEAAEWATGRVMN